MRSSWQPRILVVLVMLWIGHDVVFSRTSAEAHNIFSAIDLGIHEAGHLLTGFLGHFLSALAGTAFQYAAPLIVAFIFWGKRCYFDACFGIFWAGESMISSSYYIADARRMALPLVTPGGGEAEHDWTYLLRTLGMLGWDTTIAFWVRSLGTILVIGGILLGVVILWAMREKEQGRRAPGWLGDLIDRQWTGK